MTKSDTHCNFTMADEVPYIFTFDEDKDTLCLDLDGEIYCMGTYGNAVTFGILTAAKDTK